MQTASLDRRLSGIDAAFLYLERKELPLHIAGLCVFEGEIPFAGFVRSVDSKLHLLPRYRQVVVDPPFHLGYPSWEDDQRFDIRRHIFRATLDPPGGRAELEALAGRLLSQVMDRAKPLWDIHVIGGLEGGQGAILARVHHALADGVAGAALMNIVFDRTPFCSRPKRKPPYRPSPPSPSNRSVVDALASALRTSVESMIGAEATLLDFSRTLVESRSQEALEKLVELLPEFAASSERFVFNKPCSGERKFCWTQFPLADVQAIREAAGGKVNDVLLTVVARAVSIYAREHGDRVAGRFLRIVCPVNVRHDNGESLGNRISFLPVAVPLDIGDPVGLLAAVAGRTEIMKCARASHLVGLLANWIQSAPPPLQALFWDAIPKWPLPVPLLHMICTNIAGSPTPLYAEGRQIVAFYPHVPTCYELGVNCAFHSYDGHFYVGLTADANVVPDAGHLRDLMHRAFLDLHRAAVRKPRARKPRAVAPAPAPPRHAPELLRATAGASGGSAPFPILVE
jgi:diacylglycerol O-acyltransferase